MEKNNCIMKIVFALVVVCIEKSTSDDKLVEINHLWQPKHWNEFWFDRIIGAPINVKRMDVEVKNQLWTLTNISTFGKLRTVILLMQCGYGKEVLDYLWISAYTVIQCGNLLNDGDGKAEDCWQKLDDSLKKGAVVTYKLWAMNKYISKFDKRIIDNGFYEILCQIHDFLKRPQPCHTAAAIAVSYERIKDLATSLGNEWNKTCQPSYSVFRLEQVKYEYERLPLDLNETPKLLYDFYVDRLNAIVDSIKSHTETIGFQYKPQRKNVTFSIPTELDE